MPNYELEDAGHSAVDQAGDANLEDSGHLEVEMPEEEVSEDLEVDDGTPEELETDDQGELDAANEDFDLDSAIPDKDLPDIGGFDLGNGLGLKAGDKITPQHLHELNRGYQREAEFTRKCQELAPIRDQANQVIQNFNHVVQNEHSNPALLFNHVTPEHAIRALAAVGFDIDPELLKTIGHGSSYQNRGAPQGGQVDPQVQRELAEIREWRQQEEKQKFTSDLDAQVRAEISDITNPGLQKMLWKNILVSAALHTNKSIPQIALEERRALKEHFGSLTRAKKGTRERGRVGRTTGSSRPVTPKRPMTWDEADRSARGRLNAR